MQEKFHCQQVPKVLISKVQGVLIKKSSSGGLSPGGIKSVPEKCAAVVNPGPLSFLEACVSEEGRPRGPCGDEVPPSSVSLRERRSPL